MIYSGTSWSIDTAGWQLQDDSELLTLLPCDMDAALQFSTRHKVDGTITDAELCQMANRGSSGGSSPVSVRCGDFRGYGASYVREQQHCRVWWLAHHNVHVFVTYNCAAGNAGAHDAVVEWMLDTLRRVGDR